MTEPELLAAELKNGVLVLEMNRPKVNALNSELVSALLKAFQGAEREDDVRCVLLRSRGDNFSAGQEIAEFQEAHSRMDREAVIRRHLQQTYNPLILQIRRLPKPVIAAIQGAVSGAALGLALACDLRMAAEDAFFVVGFAGIGLAPDSAVSLLLPTIIGLGRAAQYCFSNLPIHAGQALEWGLVNRVVKADQLVEESFSMAAQLANGPIHAMGLAKRAFNKAVLPDLERVLDYEAHLQEIAGRSREHCEGLQAFIEKRSPNFRGS
jgi:2-(1,2-epoxy-1,2-dihydrophenyl)acetyl-CoA isomerase